MRYDVHGVVIEEDLGLPIPSYFETNDQSLETDLIVSRVPGMYYKRSQAYKKRSGAFFYWTTEDALVIEYEIPFLNAKLSIEDLEGNTVINYTKAFEKHGDVYKLAETVMAMKFIQNGTPLVHTAALAGDDGAFLFTALRDTGKTSTVLSLFDPDEYRFMADDQVVLDGDRVKSFPRPVNISPFTLTGDRFERRNGLIDRVKRRMARSRFEVLFGDVLGINMGEKLDVPREFVQDVAPIDTVFVLSAGPRWVQEIDPDEAVRKVFVNSVELFDPFSHYVLSFYYHCFDVDALDLLNELHRSVGYSVDSANRVLEVSSYDVDGYVSLIRSEI